MIGPATNGRTGDDLDISYLGNHDVFMRTTVTLDDDRGGLAKNVPDPAPFDYEPHDGKLLPGIDPRGFNELARQLDEERFRN